MAHPVKKIQFQSPDCLTFPTHCLPLNNLIEQLESCPAGDFDAYEQAYASHLPAVLAEPALLPHAFMQFDPLAPYTKHTLYADAEGRFSIQVLIWKVGDTTPIHNHKCWCGFGIYRGRMTEKTYAVKGNVSLQNNSRWAENQVTPLLETDLRQGEHLFYRPDTTDVHAMENTSGEIAISLHFYGINAIVGEDSVRYFFAQN